MCGVSLSYTRLQPPQRFFSWIPLLPVGGWCHFPLCAGLPWGPEAPHKAKGSGVARSEGPEPSCGTFCRICMHAVINPDMNLNDHDAALTILDGAGAQTGLRLSLNYLRSTSQSTYYSYSTPSPLNYIRSLFYCTLFAIE